MKLTAKLLGSIAFGRNSDHGFVGPRCFLSRLALVETAQRQKADQRGHCLVTLCDLILPTSFRSESQYLDEKTVPFESET